MIPDLSIAVIFKNEIRCLERCLQSVQPLRERLSCEIVMADTGSTDGSRAVAEKYANRLFDFPWVNDFSAARNALLDRCTGGWVLTLDSDEWLDADVEELAAFLTGGKADLTELAGVIQRNYTDAELSLYGDAVVPRLLRLAGSPRYEGAIHEAPVFPCGRTRDAILSRTVLHHDGYVILNEDSEAGRQKRARNVDLLRAELEREPNNLQRLQQYAEAAVGEPDRPETLRRAAALIRAKRCGWRRIGPPLLRTAAEAAYKLGLPEQRDYTELALSLFPESWFTRIDLAVTRVLQANRSGDLAGVAALCERYLEACAEADKRPRELAEELQYGVLYRYNPYVRQYMRVRLVETYRLLERYEKIPALLAGMDHSVFDAELERDLEGQLSRLTPAQRAGKLPEGRPNMARDRRGTDKKQLSVAIIFKNEIRCIERCLQSLDVLKKKFHCEIVMADTGSTDGSRAVAEKYADIVFDFPWINDFAAARNAVLDRCSGAWTLVLDCDEWLDPNLDELAEFMKGKGAHECNNVYVTVRNYTHPGFARYTDVLLPRLFRMSAEPRYKGAIHEKPVFPKNEIWTHLSGLVLHHDGYLVLNDGSEAGTEKRKRNMALIREELKKDPENPTRIIHFIDSGGQEEDFIPVLRRAAALAETKDTPLWRKTAPIILRNAAYIGNERGLPEAREWLEKGMALYPDSYYTRIDMVFLRAMFDYKDEDFQAAADGIRKYLAAYEESEWDREGLADALLHGNFQRLNPYYRQFAYLRLLETCERLRRFDEIPPVFDQIDWSVMDENAVHNLLWALMHLYIVGAPLDMDAMMLRFWDGIVAEKPDRATASERKRIFLRDGATIFNAHPDHADARQPWRMFLSLQGRCALGDAAALLAAETPEEADALLSSADDLTALPGSALAHALELGAAFPVPGKTLTLEVADALAAGLAQDAEQLRSLAVLSAAAAADEGDIMWARALLLSALRGKEWDADPTPLELLRAFVRTESLYLPLCYTENALRKPEYLPPMHRFGLRLANAFAVLDPDAVAPGYRSTAAPGLRAALDELKEAVRAAPEHKKAVDRILDELTEAG